ncbi:Meiotically up-regulated gene 82 protein [Madurella mycetomatis]|uniref:Meiotically up-regulated gene 82 protein n=1 Tax=Madurella mycetomatis TaxID=100816 RepID=A0A175W0N5_9PEZI|nr:Meiotically up-regulated gene 82 protein [Madurella mycetomatis]
MWSRHILRPLPYSVTEWLRSQVSFVSIQRSVRHQAFDASFDQDELAEARKWHKSFQVNNLPLGSTSFSRSSGPGGQHVNKTETKATTTWPVSQLLSFLPKLLHAGVRESKYYSKRSDCITIQAQTQRSRSANADENRQKLFEELQSLYGRTVPGESSVEKAKKYEALKKGANEARINFKKKQSAKKSSRKGSFD